MTTDRTLMPTASDHRTTTVLALSEKDFQSRVVQTAKLLGWMTYHTHDSRRSEPGFPDLVMIHRARATILVRELKTMKGKTTLPQQQWLAAFALLGIDAGVWRPDGILDGSIIAELKGELGAGTR